MLSGDVLKANVRVYDQSGTENGVGNGVERAGGEGSDGEGNEGDGDQLVEV